MNNQVWLKNIKDWRVQRDPRTEERELLEQLAGVSPRVVQAPAPHLTLPETALVELPGVTIVSVLIPIVDWRGAPAVAHVEVVPWRTWEDMQIAREMERQILEDTTYIGVDWGTPQTVKSVDLITGSFKTGLEYMEKSIAESLGIPISGISAPSRLLTQHFSIKDY